MSEPRKWWKEAVAYQVYPRSFQDSNGDGVGDLRGLLSRLDHLQSLGVSVVWLCPMYKSPQDDNGYDISDYQAIHHEYGTMEHFDELLTEMHRRGMRLLIDLVINHTSDEHPWFLESRASRDNPKRDWYIWRDGKPGGLEPNNWESIFGGSAWKLDEKTGQYFLHVFSARQPDLNWENHGMRAEVYRMMRWWLDKGVDGFRVDALSHMKKEPGFRDLPNPKNLPYVPSYASHMNVPGVLDYLAEICRETFSRYDIMTVGEANGVNSAQAKDWVCDGRLNMLFQFEHLSLWSRNPDQRIELPRLKDALTRWQKSGVWNALYVENHDITRVVSKWGDDGRFWRESATAIAAMYFLMKGTPFIYQGQEIGMTNTVFASPDSFDDVQAKNYVRAERAAGRADTEILAELAATSRDNARTPMQWDASKNGGFSAGKPWLAVNPNYEKINVESQEKDPASILNFYRSLAKLRASDEAWVYGDYELVLAEHPQVYAYTRGGKFAVVANLSGREAKIEGVRGELLLGNYAEKGSENLLRPYEARILRL